MRGQLSIVRRKIQGRSILSDPGASKAITERGATRPVAAAANRYTIDTILLIIRFIFFKFIVLLYTIKILM